MKKTIVKLLNWGARAGVLASFTLLAAPANNCPWIGTGGTGGTTSSKPCTTSPSQTVIVGDSYINWGTHTFLTDLAALAGETYRNYSIGGASMATGGITTLIPDQFEQAVSADRRIYYAVMDGGGNDVLIPAATWVGGGDCKNRADSPSLPVCQQIVQAALDRARTLMIRAADVGVKDVVYFFYPHVPEGTLIGGAHPNAILDYALPKARALCDSASTLTGGRMRCHFVDMVPVFEGHPEYFAAIDIHPNSTGSKAMAQAVWSKMREQCMSQKSGCCTP